MAVRTVNAFAVVRGAFEHPVLWRRRHVFSRFEAWLWLVKEAVWKPLAVRIGGRTIMLQRGQLAYSIRFLAQAWRWEQTRVVRFLKCLKTEAMITTEIATGMTVITICNYNKYQVVGLPTATATTTATATPAQQHRNKEETGETGNSTDGLRPSVARAPTNGTRLPDDFTLSEADIAFASAHGLSDRSALDRVRDSFSDYWHSKPGAGGRKVDWHATWRNWVRREQQNGSGHHARPRRSRSVVDAANDFLKQLEKGADHATGEASVFQLPHDRLRRS